MSQHPSFTMAGLLVAGGLIGFAKKRSLPSLVAGIALGSAFAYSGWLIQENRDWGHETSLVTSAVLSGAMLVRSRKLRRVQGRMPVLPVSLAVLGLLSGAYHLRKVWEYRWM